MVETKEKYRRNTNDSRVKRVQAYARRETKAGNGNAINTKEKWDKTVEERKKKAGIRVERT